MATEASDLEVKMSAPPALSYQLSASAPALPLQKPLLSDEHSKRRYDYKIFISHRGPEKAIVAFPMMAMFTCFCGSGFAFFDQTSLNIGETNIDALSDGVSGSRTCLAVLSESFLALRVFAWNRCL